MFAETEYASPSARIFNVYAEGQLVLENLNIYGEAGFQQFTAVEKMIADFTVSDGVLNLYFESIVGEPVISGIKIDKLLTTINSENPEDYDFLWDFYPNPFNNAFSIQYQLERPDRVEIDLYNIRGQHVGNILNQYKSAGSHTINYQISELSSGIYLVNLRLQSGINSMKKVIYLK
jgi:hypothetical protein